MGHAASHVKDDQSLKDQANDFLDSAYWVGYWAKYL